MVYDIVTHMVATFEGSKNSPIFLSLLPDFSSIYPDQKGLLNFRATD